MELWQHLATVADADADGKISEAEYKAAFAAGLLETPESFDQGYVPWLTHPALTGLSPTDWDTLLTRLAKPRNTQRENVLHERRGAAGQAAPGPGRRPVPTLGDRVAATLIRQRFSLPAKDIAELFEVTTTTINKVIRETSPILQQVKDVVTPATPLAALAEFNNYLTAANITPTNKNNPTL
ncbi:MAG TPA: hypothetical protein VGR06_07495 [Actinophytocola sp.]|uniref:hypothetical protein n=1 Tax=Actinophytocola sp. TaxID=1872138 RepID=UPI002DFD0303|nr:hypothetical protein [Actinophytocola sp.]